MNIFGMSFWKIGLLHSGLHYMMKQLNYHILCNFLSEIVDPSTSYVHRTYVLKFKLSILELSSLTTVLKIYLLQLREIVPGNIYRGLDLLSSFQMQKNIYNKRIPVMVLKRTGPRSDPCEIPTLKDKTCQYPLGIW